MTDSTCIAYVGADNYFMGQTMAHLLHQLRPEGGTFVLIGSKAVRNQGFLDEIAKYHSVHPPHNAVWPEVLANFSMQGNDYLAIMEQYALLNPTAMIIMVQTPMHDPQWTSFIDRHRFRNMTIVGADAADYQVEYLNEGYVDGLVGQLPYEIGTNAFQVLYDWITQGSISLPSDMVTTKVVAYNIIPPHSTAISHGSDSLQHTQVWGYACFGVVVFTVFAYVVWTLWNWSHPVVQTASPVFLCYMCLGILLWASALIPLSTLWENDTIAKSWSTSPTAHQKQDVCMSIPWLAFIGLGIIIAALGSKAWKLYQSTTRMSPCRHNDTSSDDIADAPRTVLLKDMFLPLAGLFLSTLLILLCWILLDPLTYTRLEEEGGADGYTFYWNQVVVTHGNCQSRHSERYLIPLGILHVSALVMTHQLVSRARLQSHWSESSTSSAAISSLHWAIVILLQAWLTGVPVLVAVRHQART
jgi:gamma-aminobutyric acid type B receptor